MHACHDPLHCILPPYMLDRMLEAEDREVRRMAAETMRRSAAMSAMRSTLSRMPAMAATRSPAGTKHRLVYDLRGQGSGRLPGKLVRSEGQGTTKDKAVDEAFGSSGVTYDFYKRNFGRNSLDDRGMTLISSVHVGRKFNNAFWNGEQMAYGDGDGKLFVRFTRSLDVVGHELTHGVVTHTANLEYLDEPGALNEHFADVFGSLVKQWKKKQTAAKADWLIGAEIIGPRLKALGLRTLKEGLAYEDDPYLGTDPQPKHLRDKFLGESDHGGVHINSGIPNHAFFRLAVALGGNAWERAGTIWYKTLLALTPRSQFADMVAMSLQTAGGLHGAGSTEEKAVAQAWKDVGF